MRQEEIVKVIRKKCGNVEKLPLIGWHFIYNNLHYLYMFGKDDGMIRFCIPHLSMIDTSDMRRLSEVINDTNKNVKFIKVVKLERNYVSINYDHMIVADENAETIIPHIINTMDFASNYLLTRLNDTSLVLSEKNNSMGYFM